MTGQRGRLVARMRDGWRFWRRSIQARIVVYTVVLCAIATSAVGWFMLQEVRNGLLDHRVTAVTAEATEEIQDAQARLSAASGIDVDASSQRTDLIEPIIERGLTRGFDVVLAGPISSSGSSIADGLSEFSPGLETSSVPLSLQEHFDRVAAETAWTYTSIRTVAADGAETSEPGVVLGTQVTLPADGSTYNLYFLFPLADDAATLSLITRVLIGAGFALLLLVAAVAWWVGRRVVTPIRLAREIAERLAAGQLQERMRVAGEDDLARLAVSFNQMASALQTQIRQLEELSRVQRRFTSDVSHELRTPLTTVRMAGDMLYDARDTFDPATARAAELLQSELDRFEGLLVDLLEISRFDAGAAVLELEDVDLVVVARRVVDGAQSLAAQRPVELVIQDPGRPCPAEADVRRLERILRNLVSNAIDHAPEGDRVLVTVAGDEHSAAVTVRDHGIGLMPGEAAMVFNRFWRADPARARSTGGTGLGLAIALEDTHLHHGWLQAWGRPREGAQFRLTLPRHAGETLRHSPLPLVPADTGVPAAPGDVSATPALPGVPAGPGVPMLPAGPTGRDGTRGQA